MTLVVHWGEGRKSIFDGLPWEIHSGQKTLTLFNAKGGECGIIPLEDIPELMDAATVCHVYTPATEWRRTMYD